MIGNFSEGIRLSTPTDVLLTNNTIWVNYTNGNGTHITGNTYRINMTDTTIYAHNATGVLIDGGQNISINGTNVGGTPGCYILGTNSSSSISTSGGYGVLVNAAIPRINISNCLIANFTEGVRFNTNNASVMYNNTIYVSYIGGNGTHITGAAAWQNNITSNTITVVNGSGIVVDGGWNNTIDCLGKTILGANTSMTYGVLTNQFSTIVKLRHNQLHLRIMFNASNYSNAQNNTITNYWYYGILASG